MVGKAGRKIGGEGIQMHGGVGMTDELAVGFYVWMKEASSFRKEGVPLIRVITPFMR